jgi:hypothetical protein
MLVPEAGTIYVMDVGMSISPGLGAGRTHDGRQSQRGGDNVGDRSVRVWRHAGQSAPGPTRGQSRHQHRRDNFAAK